MNEAVHAGTIGLVISMGGIALLAILAGLAVAWIENRSAHGDAH